MPRRPRPLSPDDGPLAVFAIELRALRDSCGPTAPTPDDIAGKENIHRTTVYAALSGKRVPSRDVLAAIVKHWRGDQPEWAAKRTALENALSTARQLQDRGDRSTGTPRPSGTPVTWGDLERTGVTWGELSSGRPTRSTEDTSALLRDFQDALRKLRYASGMTIREIERVTAQNHHPVPKSTIAHLLSGNGVPRWETVAQVLKALGAEDELAEWQRRWVDLRGYSDPARRLRELRDSF
ncbi:helix-turn-helix domain-containing protein [Amycolatopsis sp. NPDC003865]